MEPYTVLGHIRILSAAPIVPGIAHPERLMLSLLGWALLVCGVLMLVAGLYSWRRFAASVRWPTTPGSITSSSVAKVLLFPVFPFLLWAHKASITYRYTVGGKEYRSTGIGNGGGMFLDEGRAQQLVREYPQGSEVTVYYDPHRPRYGLLRPGTGRIGLMSHITLLIAGAVVVLVSVYIVRGAS